MNRRDLDVVLIGYYGFGNLGDELLAESAISLLVDGGVARERIAILSADPNGAACAFGVDSANRWRIAEVVGVLHRSRSLLLGGGGLFQDVTSVRSSLYYWGVIKMARLLGCKVWAVGQSVGPLHGFIARSLTADALISCKFLSVRDRGSLGTLAMLRLASKKIDVTPDLVLGLDLPPVTDGGCLMMNVRPWERVASLAVARAARNIATSRCLTIKCVAFSAEDEDEMRWLIDAGELPCVELIRVLTVRDFIDASDDASLALGMRLHFSVLSSLRGIPVCSVAYDPKVSAFAGEWGLGCVGPSLEKLDHLSADDFSAPPRDSLIAARDSLRESFSRGISTVLEV